jgi:hypothetical protein
MDNFLPRVTSWLGHVKARDLKYMSVLTGVAPGTLLNLKYGRTTRPTLPTIEKLQRYLDANGL